MSVLFVGILLPWLVFFICLLVQKRIPFLQRLLKKYEIGTGFWGALSLSLPFFAYGVVRFANSIFKLSYFPFYVCTVLLIGAGMIAVQIYFYRSFIWKEYIKVTWRFTTIITVLAQFFFILSRILVSLTGQI